MTETSVKTRSGFRPRPAIRTPAPGACAADSSGTHDRTSECVGLLAADGWQRRRGRDADQLDAVDELGEIHRRETFLPLRPGGAVVVQCRRQRLHQPAASAYLDETNRTLTVVLLNASSNALNTDDQRPGHTRNPVVSARSLRATPITWQPFGRGHQQWHATAAVPDTGW